MTDEGQNDSTIKKEALDVSTLEKSEAFITDLLRQLGQVDSSEFEELSLSYTQSFDEVLKQYPNQVVAVVTLLQPDVGTIMYGYLHPETQVLVGKRSPGKLWGANTWAVPMGKIDPQSDDKGLDHTLGTVIQRAALRETYEEVIKEETGGYQLIAGSYIDHESGNLIHIVLDEICPDRDRKGPPSVQLPNTREHSEVGWINLRDVPSIIQITSGIKEVYKTALKFLLGQNKQAKASNRFI